MKVTVAVVGATGYTGAEIVRLLAGHPNAEVAVVTSERQAGQPLRSSCPWLATDLVLTRFDPCGWEVDVVFLCQENGSSAKRTALPCTTHRALPNGPE